MKTALTLAALALVALPVGSAVADNGSDLGGGTQTPEPDPRVLAAQIHDVSEQVDILTALDSQQIVQIRHLQHQVTRLQERVRHDR